MASVERTVAKLDREVERFIFRTGAVIDSTANAIESDLGSEPTERQTISRLGNLEGEIYREGFTELLQDLARTYGRIMADVQEALKEQGFDSKFDENELSLTQSLIDVDQQALRGHVTNFVNRVKSLITKSVVSGLTVDIFAVFDASKGILLRALEKELINALQGFRNALQLRKAKQQKVERFLYAGPKDAKNRPFCASNVGKTFTLEEIKSMDNGQGLPVLTNLGGWNCRHEWRPVKK